MLIGESSFVPYLQVLVYLKHTELLSRLTDTVLSQALFTCFSVSTHSFIIPPISRGILKALKVLAIAHDFLGQHGSTLSFTPSGYDVNRILSQKQDHPASPSSPVASSDDNQKVMNDVVDRFPVSNQGWHTEHFFALKVWRRLLSRRQIEVEVRPGKGGPPLYDFSLDARRDWKSKAVVSEDLSYSLADMLYGLLVERPLSQAPFVSTESHPGAEASSDASASASQAGLAMSGPVLLSADMAQAPTLFMALTLFQQRLRVQGSSVSVVCTVYRNTIAPRLDGRNGFVFKVWTQLLPKPQSARKVPRASRSRSV